MLRKALVAAVLLCPAFAGQGWAAAYFEQANLPAVYAETAGLDRDSLGNLYVLGRSTADATFKVSVLAVPAMDVLFSFDTGVSSPVAFAVEDSGLVDVVDAGQGSAAIRLRRFQNTGTLVGQSTYSVVFPYYDNQLISAAIDKTNARLYLTYQQMVYYFCVQQVGGTCRPSGVEGFVQQFDFAGTLLGYWKLPGTSAIAGTCYTPSYLAVDREGSVLVADAACQHVFRYSATGALASDWPASRWTGSYQFMPRGMWTDRSLDLYISQPVCGPSGCQPGVVKLDAAGNLLASVAGDSRTGTAWDERILYLAGPACGLRRMVYNTPPGVPTETYPVGPAVQHSSSAILAWQYAGDSEADEVVYSVSLGTSPTGLAVVGTAMAQSLVAGPLAFEATYYWQVTAQDRYESLLLQQRQAPVVSFRLSLQNSAPGSFSVLAGTGTAVTRETKVRLSWQRPVDADADPVVFDVFWRSALEPSLVLIASTTAVSWDQPGLVFGATYYWSVRARDVYAASTWLAGEQEQRYTPVFANQPPEQPLILAGVGTSYQHTLSPEATLAWSSALDPDWDTVVYRLSLGTSTQAMSLVQDGPGTGYSLPSPQLGATYYWQVSAFDSYGGSTMTAVQSLSIQLSNLPPSVPGNLSRTGTVKFHGFSPSLTLLWNESFDPEGDPVVYAVIFGTAAGSLAGLPAAFLGDVVDGLSVNTTYYYRVVATDSYGASSNSPLNSVHYEFSNQVPSAFSILGTTGTVASRDNAVILSWRPSADADNDAISYLVHGGTNPASLSIIDDTPETSSLLDGLTFGSTYYWKVEAYDGFGGTRTATGGVQSFHLAFRNLPPSLPVYLTTATVFGFHAEGPSVNLAWKDSVDPDSDPVSYRLDIRTSTADVLGADLGASTSFVFEPSFDTAYYWRVIAFDPYSGSSTGPWSPLVARFINQPPYPVVYASTSSVATRAETFALSWRDTGDPDGDAYSYSLYLATDPARLELVQHGSQTSYWLRFQFGTTYYWQVRVADSFGALTSGATQAFLPVFRNSPPSVPANLSQTGTVAYHGFSPSLPFFWQEATDPDADAVSYSVFFGTAPAALTRIPSATLGQTIANLSVNTAYYYRIVATDIFGASSDSPVNWVYYQFANQGPAAFSIIGTTGPVSNREASVRLSWAPSSDADGDSLGYRVFAGTAPASLSLVAEAAQTWTQLPGLAFGSTHYWKVEAYDGYGGTTTALGGIQSFQLFFKNSQPTAPMAAGGAGTLALHTTTPQAILSWSQAIDLDGDAVGYRVWVGTSASSLGLAQDGPQPSYELPSPQFGTTYYWQVSAYDPYGAVSTAAVQSLYLLLRNANPAGFSATTNSGTLRTRERSVLLNWEPALDPDADPVTYGLRLSTIQAVMPLVSVSTAPGFNLAFDYGATYYWLVEAYDGFGATTTITGGLRTFLPLFLSDPPSEVSLSAPFKGSPMVKTMSNQVDVSWEKVSNPQADPITYTVLLGGSPQALEPVSRISLEGGSAGMRVAAAGSGLRPSSEVRLDGDVIHLTLTGLDYYRSYYLQIEASNPFGARSTTELQSFSLSPLPGFPKAYNYPNPFSPGRGGTSIVFNAPASGYARAVVSVYSEWQDLLFQREYAPIPPGVSEVRFDGRDRFGKALFNGSYIAMVRFNGPDDQETFHLMVVK